MRPKALRVNSWDHLRRGCLPSLRRSVHQPGLTLPPNMLSPTDGATRMRGHVRSLVEADLVDFDASENRQAGLRAPNHERTHMRTSRTISIDSESKHRVRIL